MPTVHIQTPGPPSNQTDQERQTPGDGKLTKPAFESGQLGSRTCVADVALDCDFIASAGRVAVDLGDEDE